MSKKSLSVLIASGIVVWGGIGLLSQTEDNNPNTQNFTNTQQVENDTQEDAELDNTPEIEDTTSGDELPENLPTDTSAETVEVYEPAPQVEPQAQAEPVYVAPAQTYTAPEPQSASTNYQESTTDCNIKGNVNSKNHTKIYHTPGSRYYDSTIVDPSKGDQWFCSIEEAIAAGFRAPKR